ncbi:MAG: type IV pilus modification protein PilV [Gammaproteobacteria bacterium]|nr:type IV pilus modification protein PilV [Gammaproteobacteria bacterium]
MNARTNSDALRIACPRCRGLTLIEVLISLIILSLGILGLTTLQTASLNFNSAASQRTQATVLAYGMADRMRANRQAALGDAYNIAVEDPAPACAAPSTAGTLAAQDISAWRMALACRLPLGTGSITRNGNEFTLTVFWDDSHGQETPLQLQVTTAL